MFSLIRKQKEVTEMRAEMQQAALVAEAEAPAIVEAPVVVMPDKPVAKKAEPTLSEVNYAQYAAVAEKVGFMVPEMLIEKMKLFLAKHDLPTYSLKAVVEYMDAIAKRDNPDGYGWHWVPLRPADAKFGIHFGRAWSDGDLWSWSRMSRDKIEKVVASDYFASSVSWGSGQSFPRAPYDKVVPMHALERVALIEKEFGPEKIAFAVSDYATQPHIRPDPFLMVMVPNQRIGDGVGRFVIDVWDEPGFGILEMVK